MIEALMNLDSNILIFIQEYIRNSVLTPFFITITSLGDVGFIWIILSIVLLISKKTRKIGIMSICALLGSLLINNVILKNLIARTRPYEVLTNLVLLIKKPVDYSFPSGHTGSSFAVACIIYRRMPRKYGILAITLAVLIGFSRLYVGVHYPSDVIFGMISGIFIGYLVEILYTGFFEKHKEGYFF